MRYTIINGELYHHGVKGMRWGVRRERKSYGERRAEAYGKKAIKEIAKGDASDPIKLKAYNAASSLMRRRSGLGRGVEEEYNSVAQKRIRIAKKTSRLLQKINDNNEIQIHKKLGKLAKRAEQSQKYEKWIDTHMNQINAGYKGMLLGSLLPGALGATLVGAFGSVKGKRKDQDPAEQKRMANELAERDVKDGLRQASKANAFKRELEEEQKRKKKPIK